jgi:hypothetical protein
MVLDFMLDRLDTRFLSTESEKVEFFTSLTGITVADLPRVTFQSTTVGISATDRYFVERFPIGIAEATIQFQYFDEGAFTTKAFVGYLQRYRPLLSKLESFELSYIALNGSNFASAQKEFARVFPADSDRPSNQRLLPRGAEHLAEFFRAQQLWDKNSTAFRHQDLLILREGEKLYTTTDHADLQKAWALGNEAFRERLSQLRGGSCPRKAAFKTLLIEQSYPVFGNRNPGSWQQNRVSVLDSVAGSI